MTINLIYNILGVIAALGGVIIIGQVIMLLKELLKSLKMANSILDDVQDKLDFVNAVIDKISTLKFVNKVVKLVLRKRE
ncbi:MAG: hypothetical protein ACK5HL_03885 [Bacilli bacterium]